jgi:hypothetical protein
VSGDPLFENFSAGWNKLQDDLRRAPYAQESASQPIRKNPAMASEQPDQFAELPVTCASEEIGVRGDPVSLLYDRVVNVRANENPSHVDLQNPHARTEKRVPRLTIERRRPRKPTGSDPFTDMPEPARSKARRVFARFSEKWDSKLPHWREESRLKPILVGQARRLALDPPDSAWGRRMLAKRGGYAAHEKYRAERRQLPHTPCKKPHIPLTAESPEPENSLGFDAGRMSETARGQMNCKPRSVTAQVNRNAPLAEPATGTKLLLPRVRKKSGLSPYHGPITALCTFLHGGKRAFMELAKMAPQIEPALAALIEDWERLNYTVKRAANLDDMCKLRGIDPAHFLSVVGEAAMKFRDDASIIITAMNMPKIVSRSVKQALNPEGVDDKRMIFQHANFIPTSKVGTEVNVLNQAAAKAEVNLTSKSTLESFEKTVRAADELIHERE